jgi:sec-independent protein translocase protein TatA
MFGLGAPELLIVFLIIIVLFGSSRLPELAKGLGSSITEFKKGLQSINNTHISTLQSKEGELQ